MPINWTVVTYFVIGAFALSGFFKGWWREAITTVFLVVLVFFLQQPAVAQAFTDLINRIIAMVWNIAPQFFSSLMETLFGVETGGAAVQANASDAGTWLLILPLFVVFAILISRLFLPSTVRGGNGQVYTVRPMGSLLGALIGGLNGFIIVNLVREYLDGRNLPSGGPATELTFTADGPVGTASSGVSIQAVELPSITLFDSFLPWIIIGLGLIILLAVIRNRISVQRRDGYRKVDYKAPLGYQRREY